MALKRMMMQLGMGTDIRGEDYTKAACRAVHNTLRQNSLNVYDAFGVSRDEMKVEIVIGVADPDAVDKEAVGAMLPYGDRTVRVEAGGMNTRKDNGTLTILANAVVIVYLDLPDGKNWGAA